MITTLERLANETLFDLFEYVDGRDLWHGFWALNKRFNNLIQSATNLSFVLGENNEEIIPFFAHHVYRLEVVNTARRTFDLSHFPNLYSLTLMWATAAQLNQIQPELMLNLVYFSSTYELENLAAKKLACEIFSNGFPSLRYVRLECIDMFDIRPWSQSPSLRSVHISSRCSLIIPHILAACPHLYNLQVDFVSKPYQTILALLPQIDDHPLRRLVLSDTRDVLIFRFVDQIFSYTPNVTWLKLKFFCDTPFIHLLQSITHRLLHLNRFDCRITDELKRDPIDMNTIRQFHSCFNRIQCHVEHNHSRVFTTD